jgi:hypothetical protein
MSLFRKWVVVATVAAMLGTAGTSAAAPGTPPGGDDAYQVEISANVGGPSGGGSWYWLELDKDGGGIYAGSDCGRGAPASGARGTLSWEQQGESPTTCRPSAPSSSKSCAKASMLA